VLHVSMPRDPIQGQSVILKLLDNV